MSEEQQKELRSEDLRRADMVEGLRRLGSSPSDRSPDRRTVPYWILISAVVLVAAAVFIWWLSREQPPALLFVEWPDFANPAEQWEYRVNSRRFLVIVRPGGRVHVRADAASGVFSCPDVGDVPGVETSFEGPAEGNCRYVRFVGVDSEEKRVSCRLAILSIRSSSAGEILGRDRAGAYPNPAKAGTKKIRENAGRYAEPEHWVSLSELELWPVSDNFLLGDFLGDRLGRKTAPMFMALDYRLVWKLERIERALQEARIAYRSMRVISGFREPLYNRSKDIAGSKFSRHQYGDAVDFIVDRDRDGKWDDLDGDGDTDFDDVKIVARLVEDLEMNGDIGPGGIGAYRGSNDSVMGSVHVDCRGVAARWGTTWRKGKSTPIEWWSEKYKAPDDEEDESDGDAS
ncbi:hypothetical protein ACFL01_01485 [Planctomycetota bacterium]